MTAVRYDYSRGKIPAFFMRRPAQGKLPLLYLWKVDEKQFINLK